MICLIGASLAVRRRAGPRLTSLLGVAEAPSTVKTLRRHAEAERIGRAVTRVASVLPWQPTCLRQAIATRWMLQRRGIACQAHLGIVNTQPFEAHAWVTVHGTVVQGGPVRHATEIAVLR